MSEHGLVLNPSGNGAKLIVGVDDDQESLSMMKHVVEGAGYVFLSAVSGHECISLLGRIQPRLLFLDIQMPDMDGFTTCRRIRAELNLAQMPIVFLTGRKSPEDVKHGIAAGGNDYVIKPFEVMTLLDRLRYWTTHRAKPTPISASSY
jgi:two-component system OmpR family response regulator